MRGWRGLGGYGGVPSTESPTSVHYCGAVYFHIRGDVHITLAQRGEGGVPGLLTEANRGRGGLGHVNVSKKPQRSMRTNNVILAFQV